MTSEPTQPSAEAGQMPANAAGSSQGHRRRRRRRKNKPSQPGAAQAQQGAPQAASAPQIQASQPRAPQQQGRKKKKFFPKGGSQQQPGNSVHGGQGGHRKERQRGPRMFVGPMDHSYRAANGNVAEGSQSTIPAASNGHSAYYSEPFGTPAPVRHDAPTRIYCFIDDLFFQAKIQETSRKLGVKVEFVKGDKEAVARIIDAPEGERPSLVVFDLNNANAKPMVLIPKLKAKFKRATSVVGFLNHLQGDLKIKALEAGCDTVMPRSAFSQTLPNLLRRYGLEDEDEYAPQPMNI